MKCPSCGSGFVACQLDSLKCWGCGYDGRRLGEPLNGATEVKVPELGPTLRDLRAKVGLTQRQVAAEVHRDFTYISKIENGHDLPGKALLRTLAALYDTDVALLFSAAGFCPHCFGTGRAAELMYRRDKGK